MVKLISDKIDKISYRSAVTIALLIVVVLIGVFIQYARTVVTLTHQVTYTYLAEISSFAAREVKTKFVGNMQSLKSMAVFLESNQFDGVDKVVTALHNDRLENEFDHIVYILPDGKGYGDGVEGIDFSGRPYFTLAMAGEESVIAFDESLIDGENVLVYATPRYQDGQVVGVLIGVQNQMYYQNMINERTMGGEGFFNVIDDQGNMVIRSKHKNSDQDLENIFEGAYFSDLTKRESLLADLQDGKSGILEYSIDNVPRMMVYTPIGFNEWYMMAVVPSWVVNQQSNVILFLTGLFSLLAIISLVGLFIYTSLKQTKNRKQIMQLAYEDQATGGLNLNKFKLVATEILARKREKKLALMRIDVDSFKMINEMYGFEAGDEVLKNIDLAIRNVPNNYMVSGRIANDDFAVLVAYQRDEELDIQRDQFLEQFQKLHAEQGKTYKIDFTLGIYKIPQNENDIAVILERATMAHKAAKNSGSQHMVFYEDSIRDKAVMNKIIENTMHQALERGEFVVYFQPKYDLQTEKIAGAEALIRWITDEQVMRSPDEFIPVFEKNGFVVEIDLFVLEQVCKLQRYWLDNGVTPVTISVNQSKLLVSSGDYINKVHNIVQKYQVPPQLIELELTETILHDDIDILNSLTLNLQKMGYVISIDDFGSGYSSLNLLKEIHADVLKIDREFLNRAENNARGRIVLSNIIRLAKELNMSIVTEGVETRKQADMLRKLGCDTAQGFLFAKPMPVAEFEKRL